MRYSSAWMAKKANPLKPSMHQRLATSLSALECAKKEKSSNTHKRESPSPSKALALTILSLKLEILAKKLLPKKHEVAMAAALFSPKRSFLCRNAL